jgi:hypothetical protein
MRTSEPKPHKLLVSVDSEVRKRSRKHNDANFGIGTLAPFPFNLVHRRSLLASW